MNHKRRIEAESYGLGEIAQKNRKAGKGQDLEATASWLFKRSTKVEEPIKQAEKVGSKLQKEMQDGIHLLHQDF